MWSDNESLSDYIDYSHLVNAVTGIINNDDLIPCSIGIFGDWGSGKSSLMRMVEAEYENKENVLVLKFNGWLFEGYEDAKTVLMGRIVDEIINKRKFNEKALKYAAKLLKRIDWMKVAGSAAKYGVGFLAMGPAGIAAAGITDALKAVTEADYSEYITKKQENATNDPDESLRTNIQEFHQNFADLLQETKISRLVVFIDDLDRCSADTVIGTLEAIKLFLFTKNTSFVIGADERLIKYAVRRRFPDVPGENMEVGRDYLEKLIQYPIRIPPLNIIELTIYINLLFTKLYRSAADFEKVRNAVILKKREDGFNFVFDESNFEEFLSDPTSELRDGIALCSQIVPVLSTGLNGNPRQVKRFLNTLLVRINMAAAKNITLKRRVLAKLMLLEYFKPETFTRFHDIQAMNNGSIPTLAPLEKSAAGRDDSEGELSSEQKILKEDKWLMDWITSEPNLSREDLQPYFYFSRDKLTITAVNMQRMTPKAQEVIQKLLSESQGFQIAGAKEISNLSMSEASSIFEALTQRVRQEETVSGENAAFKGLFELARAKADLKSQIITFLQTFPDHRLPLNAITLSEGLLKDNELTTLRAFLTKWSKSTNIRFANLAKKKLK
jgi:hypothetical protein